MKDQITVEQVENGFIVKLIQPGHYGPIGSAIGPSCKETVWICATKEDVCDRIRKLLPN